MTFRIQEYLKQNSLINTNKTSAAYKVISPLKKRIKQSSGILRRRVERKKKQKIRVRKHNYFYYQVYIIIIREDGRFPVNITTFFLCDVLETIGADKWCSRVANTKEDIIIILKLSCLLRIAGGLSVAVYHYTNCKTISH